MPSEYAVRAAEKIWQRIDRDGELYSSGLGLDGYVAPEIVLATIIDAAFAPLLADVERLRKALERIREWDYRGNRCSCGNIARAALEEKA